MIFADARSGLNQALISEIERLHRAIHRSPADAGAKPNEILTFQMRIIFTSVVAHHAVGTLGRLYYTFNERGTSWQAPFSVRFDAPERSIEFIWNLHSQEFCSLKVKRGVLLCPSKVCRSKCHKIMIIT